MVNAADRSGASRRQVMAWGAASAALVVAGEGRAQGLTPVKIIHPTPAALPLWAVTFLAEDMGFYREEGLAIERVKLNGGPAALTALIAGEGLANASAPGELIGANARGQRVKVIEGYTKTDGSIFAVSAKFADKYKITAASSLAQREAALRAAKGARYGITAPGSQTDLVTRLAVRQAGLDAARDVSIVPMGNVVNVISALNSDRIEGGILLSPFAEQAMAEMGAVALMSVPAGDIPAAGRLQGQVLEARAADVAANPDLFARIVRADLRALRVILETPDQARDTLHRTRFANLKPEIWQLTWKNQLPTFASPFVTPDALQAWIETGIVGGNIDPASFPYGEVIDMQFVEAGLKALRWTPKV